MSQQRPRVVRSGDRIFIDFGHEVPLSLSIDRALELAKDIAVAAEGSLSGESCPCGSGKDYGYCCLGSGV